MGSGERPIYDIIDIFCRLCHDALERSDSHTIVSNLPLLAEILARTASPVPIVVINLIAKEWLRANMDDSIYCGLRAAYSILSFGWRGALPVRG